MPLSQIVFFAGWLAASLLGGALILYVWQRLLAKNQENQKPPVS